MMKNFIEPCNSSCSFCFLNYADVLSENYLFRNLTTLEISTIIKKTPHQVRAYKKGSMIALEGSEYNSLMLIVKGLVVGEMIDFDGKVLQVERVKAPETVASAFIFGDKNILPLNLIAAEDVKMLLLQKQALLQLFKGNETIMLNFLNILANTTQKLSKKINLLGMQTIKGRIAYYLLEQVKQQKTDKLTIPNTQNELAEMFGVTRPSLSRAMRELNNENYLIVSGKKIEISDKIRLSNLLK